MVIRTSLWAEPVRGAKPEEYKEKLVAAGYTVIPAFSLMEVEIACKVRVHTLRFLIERLSLQRVNFAYLREAARSKLGSLCLS